MTRVFSTVIVALIGASLSGQTVLDSLLRQLSVRQHDTTRARLYDRISYEYSDVNPDSGIIYGNMALQLSIRAEWQPGIAAAYSDIAINSAASGRYAEALYYHEKAMAVYDSIGKIKSVAAVLTNMSTVYEKQGDYASALSYAHRALELYEMSKDSVSSAYVFESIGTIYFRQKDYEAAMDNYTIALLMHEKKGNQRRVAGVLGNIGMVHDGTGNYREAVTSHTRALHINRALKNEYGQQVNLMNIGLVYCHTRVYDSALYYQRQSLVISQRNALRADIAINTGNIGETFYQMALDSAYKNDSHQWLDSAIVYLRNALDLCKDIGYYGPMIEFGNFLAEAYSFRGQHEFAFMTLKEIKKAEDSLSLQEQAAMIRDIETKRMLLLKEKEIEIHETLLQIAELEARNRTKENYIYVLSIFILILIIIGLIRRYILRIRRHNAILDDLAFMQSHELRSPIARMLGLVQLAQKEKMGSPMKDIMEHIDTTSREIDNVVRKATERTVRKEPSIFQRMADYLGAVVK